MFKKRTVIATFTLLGLIGCGVATQSAYEHFMAGKPWKNFAYKAGDQASLGQDTTNCRVEAEQRVPQRQVANTTPSFTTNTQTFCNRIGNQTLCNTTGGQTIGGNTYVTDANAELRERVFRQCMVNKNYRYVDLPPCPAGVVLRAGDGGLPPLSNTTCYRVRPDGSWTIGRY